MKTCTRCEKEQELDQFQVSKKKYLGNICRLCRNMKNRTRIANLSPEEKQIRKEKIAKTAEKHKGKILKKKREMYAADPEKMRARSRRRYTRHRDKILEKNKSPEQRKYIRDYMRNQRKIDIQARLRSVLRSRLYGAIINGVKCGSAVSDLGCTLSEFQDYLERRFTEGMNWENYGLEGWHIDHIRPLSSFDLTNSEQFKQACHYTNMQPLWAEDNLRKSDKYEISA